MSKKPLKKIICTNNPKQEYGGLQKRQTEKAIRTKRGST